MAQDFLGIGIVGAGKAGSIFARTLQGIPQTRLVGFCTAHRESSAAAAEKYGAPVATTELEELLAHPDLQAVIVASPDEFHCSQVRSAAAAGKHVLCEKPMCRTLEEAEDMINTARKKAVVLMVGFTDRFNQPCLEAKRQIEAGEIGEPKMILARRCHTRSTVRGRTWLNDEQTGGVLNFAGTHNIDLICWLMGSPPVRVYGEMGQLILSGQNFTDCAVMTFKFASGAVATLYETFAYPPNYPHGVDRSLEILGDRGVLHLDLMSQPLRRFTANGMTLSDSQTWPQSEQGITGAIRAELEHFVRCVRDGAQPMTGGEEGKLALRIANAARRASDSGRAENI